MDASRTPYTLLLCMLAVHISCRTLFCCLALKQHKPNIIKQLIEVVQQGELL
jgi:hypothetical protein